MVRLPLLLLSSVAALSACQSLADSDPELAMRLQEAREWTIGVKSSRGVASGLILNTAGLILTSSMAVDASTSSTIVLPNGRETEAFLIRKDDKRGLALLQGRHDAFDDIVPPELNRSKLKTGTEVFALGSRLASGSRGEVVSYEKAGEQEQLVTSIDADVAAPGCALVDERGKLLGLVTSPKSARFSDMIVAISARDIARFVSDPRGR